MLVINDILDLSKIEANKMEIDYAPKNPLDIFNEIQGIFHLKASVKNLNFIIDIDETLPPLLLLDETRLRQILLNLVGNAIKFTEEGHVKLSVKNIFNPEEPEKTDLIISIEDTGIGIPEKDQKKIFEVFEQQFGQSTRQYGGTGLGLSICKRLVEMMNGRITVKSRVGEGSTFQIRLRDVIIFRNELLAVVAKDFDIRSIAFKKGKVLVVDDVRSNRELVTELLSNAKLDVLSAENGQEAILIAEEYQPDVILMDLRMPVMDGVEASNRLMQNPKTRGIPIIVLTASARTEDRMNMKDMGFKRYLTKPVNSQSLFAELAQYIPYKEKKVPKELPEAELSRDTIDRLPELIRTLQEEILTPWKNLKSEGKMGEVKAFGNRIKSLGDRFNAATLVAYGDSLIEYAGDYDITEIKTTLEAFPLLVEKLVKQMEG